MTSSGRMSRERRSPVALASLSAYGHAHPCHASPRTQHPTDPADVGDRPRSGAGVVNVEQRHAMNAFDVAQSFIEICQREPSPISWLTAGFEKSIEALGFQYFACC